MSEAYDAGLLNDWGGGNVEWWQDYIRAELERSHEFYAARIADLQRQLAEAREVKPLEWGPVNDDGRIQDAIGFNSVYRAWLSHDGVARWQAKYMGEWLVAKDLEAAKAAAQRDYESRILSALKVIT